MKKIISYIFVTLLLISCSKQKNQEHTLTGRLMQSCDIPAANKDAIIRFPGGGILSNPATTLEFTTDENGYFKVTHDDPFTEFSVRTSSAHSVLEVNSIPGDDNDLGDIYINPFPTNFIIKLDVNNPYSVNDTLVMHDFSSSDPFASRLIPGPFESGFLDSIVSHNYKLFPIKRSDITKEGGPRNAVTYRLRSLPAYIGNHQSVDFYIAPICSGEFAEVTLTID